MQHNILKFQKDTISFLLWALTNVPSGLELIVHTSVFTYQSGIHLPQWAYGYEPMCILTE